MKGKTILIAILTVLLLGNIQTVFGATWYDPAFPYSREITINSGLVSLDQPNFPVKIQLNSSNFNFSRTTGHDIRFTTQDNLTSLPYDRVTYNQVAENATFYVLLPQLNASSDTKIYLYYGDASQSDGEDTTMVWKDQYVGVYHMNGTIDSSGNGNDVSATSDAPTAKVNGVYTPFYYQYDGFNDGHTVADDASLDQTRYIMAWAYRSGEQSDAGAHFHHLVSKDEERGLTLDGDENPDQMRAHWFGDDFSSGAQLAWAVGEWSLIISTGNITTDTGQLYVNGSLGAEGTVTANIQSLDNAEPFRFAGGQILYCSTVWLGEIRLMNVSKGSAWVESEYYSEISALQTIGVEYAVGDAVSPKYSSVSSNTTLVGTDVLLTSTWLDDTDLSHYIYGHNNTGVWVNETVIAFSTNPETVTLSFILNTTIGVDVQWACWANDTAGNWNNTGIQTIVTTLNPAGIISLTFTDIDEDHWMFYGEPYTFEVKALSGTYTEIAFSDGFNTHIVGWDNSTQAVYKTGSMDIVNYDVEYNVTNINATFTVTMGTGVADSLYRNYTAYNYYSGSTPAYDLGAVEVVTEVLDSGLAGFDYGVLMTIDETKIDSGLFGFQVLVYLDDSRIDWSHVNDDISDIRFVDPNLNLLDYEVEEYHENINATIWVQVPLIYPNDDTYIWMFYGNQTPVSSLSSGADTFDNWYAVYHFSEDTIMANDSTVNNRWLSEIGDSVDPLAPSVNSKMGYAYIQDGANGYLYRDDTDFQISSDPFSVMCWVNDPLQTPNSTYVGVGDVHTVNANRQGWGLMTDYQNGSVEFDYLQFDTPDILSQAIGGDGAGDDYWQFLVGVYSGDSIILYGNGSGVPYDFDTGVTGNPQTSARSLTAFGYMSGDDTDEEGLNYGQLDEIRVNTSALDGDWVKAEYYSQTDDLISYSYEENFGATEGSPSYVNFYHLGGMSVMSVSGGGGGRLEGGDVFNLYADTLGTVTADAIYRKLQHFHILFDFSFPEENINRTGSGIEQSVTYNLDFYYNGAWQEGLECDIGVYGGFSGDEGALTEFTVTWRYNGTVLKSDRLIGLYEGGAGETNDKQSTSLYVDLWFNKINGSTVVGGRVYPEWYGLLASGGAIWWKPFSWWDGASWTPLYTNTTHSLAFTNLDVNSETITCKDLELMKVKCTVDRSDDGSYTTSIKAINELEFNALNEKGYMSGINTPPAHDIKTFETSKGGVFGSVITALTGVVRAIGEVLGEVSTIAVSGVDTLLAGWLGEGTFILLVKSIVDPALGVVENLSELLEIVPKMVVYFSNVVTLSIELLTYVFDGVYYFFVNGTQLIFFPLSIMSAILSGSTTLNLAGTVMDITLVSVIMGAIMGLFEIIMLWEAFVWFGGGTHRGGFFDVDFDPFIIPSRMIQTFEWMKRAYDAMFWVLLKGKALLIGAVNALLGLVGRSIGGGAEA